MVPSALPISLLFDSSAPMTPSKSEQVSSPDEAAPGQSNEQSNGQSFAELLDAQSVATAEDSTQANLIHSPIGPNADQSNSPQPLSAESRNDHDEASEMPVNPLALEFASQALVPTGFSTESTEDTSSADITPSTERIDPTTSTVIDGPDSIDSRSLIADSSETLPSESDEQESTIGKQVHELGDPRNEVDSGSPKETSAIDATGQDDPANQVDTPRDSLNSVSSEGLTSSTTTKLDNAPIPNSEIAGQESNSHQNANNDNLATQRSSLEFDRNQPASDSAESSPDQFKTETQSKLAETTTPISAEATAQSHVRSTVDRQSQTILDAPVAEESLRETPEPTIASQESPERLATTAQYAENFVPGLAAKSDRDPLNPENIDVTDEAPLQTEQTTDAPEEPILGEALESNTTSLEHDSASKSRESEINRFPSLPASDSATTESQTNTQSEFQQATDPEIPWTPSTHADGPASYQNLSIDPTGTTDNGATSTTNLVSQTSAGAATGVADGIANARAMSATEQAVAAVASVIESADGKSKTMSFNMEPADLGKLTIQITQSGEAIAAQIIASEIASSDLISAQKETLQQALNELGFDDVSVDVSHDNLSDRDDNSSPTLPAPKPIVAFESQTITSAQAPTTSGNGLNIVA